MGKVVATWIVEVSEVKRYSDRGIAIECYYLGCCLRGFRIGKIND